MNSPMEKKRRRLVSARFTALRPRPCASKSGAVLLRIVLRHCCEERREVGIAQQLQRPRFFISPVTCICAPVSLSAGGWCCAT